MDALPTTKWIRLDRLCLADLPHYGDVPGCYMFREATSGEIIYIGSTSKLGRRLFGNYIGGIGGATTKRVHAALFEPEVLTGVEVTWFASDHWKTLEIELKHEYALLGARPLPRWVRR
jgi:hypothetical protein